MSALDQIRASLDQLMGTGRDGENNKFKVKFDDPRVCKSFLLGCCPHEILSSTRMDLGECPKIHDLALKADYEMAMGNRDYYYDIDAMEHLQSFIGDCDRRTELAKKRLKETQEELSEEASAKAEVIQKLGEQIGTMMAQAEEIGEKGDVDASLRIMQELEDIKKKKAEAEIEYRDSMPASSYQQQKLRVCEVCSAYLGIHDNDRRLADHFGGKLHLGFITIREKLANLQKSVQDRRAQRELEREERRREREKEDAERLERQMQRAAEEGKQRSRSQERAGGDEKEKEREDKDRSDRRRSRSRSRDRRRRRRSRSRSRDRRRRRSRDRRSRSRSKRSRSRSRRSRSRSGRHRRSRSRSHKRSRRSRSRSRSSRSRRSKDRSSRDKSREKSSEKDKSKTEEKPAADVSNGEPEGEQAPPPEDSTVAEEAAANPAE